MVKAVVGANWGDEGKGKITDMLAREADIIVRFQGGANAGHTIVNDYGKFALHTLPSGVFYGHTTSVIGNGVALNIPVLIGEIKSITDRDVPMPKILVSDRAQIVMPYHILFDQYEEERLGGKSFGSTKSGIAPFYSDKYAKIGFQVCELFDEKGLREKLERVVVTKNVLLEHLYHKPLLDVEELFATLMEYKEMIAPYVCDTALFLENAIAEGKTVLLELNGKTLTNNAGSHTITVTLGSNLTVQDSVGGGLVDNVSHARAAILNNGTATLNGGKYDRSKENGQNSENAGGNSYYAIVNHGTMTINDGVTVAQNGHFSSMIENGYQNYSSSKASTG